MKRVLIACIIAVMIVAGYGRLAGGLPPGAAQAATTFSEGFSGGSSAPQPFASPRWHVFLHARDDVARRDGMRTTTAHHGPDCAPPMATHTVDTWAGSVFLCRDHLMTTLNAAGYGATYLTPNHLLDFSQGEAVLRFDLSTFRSTHRDWWDIVITPPDDHLFMPLDDGLPDGYGLPRRGVRVRVEGTDRSFLMVDVFRNFDAEEVAGRTTGYESFLEPSPTRRDTIEVRLSRTHLKVGFPAHGQWYVDTDIAPLDWSQGVVQLGHHTYSPEKAPCLHSDPCLFWNTWHWDNVVLAPAQPVTLVGTDLAVGEALTARSNRLRLAQPAPAHSQLRFQLWGSDPQVSFDGGQRWQAASRVASSKHDQPIGTWVVAVPAGATEVLVQADPGWDGRWYLNGAQVWSSEANLAPLPTSTATATATPTAVATSAVPAPTPTATPTSTTVAPTATAPSTSLSFDTKATISPASASTGQTVTLRAAVTSTQDTTALIDIEVYSPTGTKVHQEYFDNQALTANTERGFGTSWQVPSSATAGTYSVKIGVFKPGWAGLLDWNDAAGNLAVTTGTPATATSAPAPDAAPAATNTPTPTATSTPTPQPAAPATSTPTPQPTATATPRATATPTPQPTATPAPPPAAAATATPTPAPLSFTSSASLSTNAVARGQRLTITAKVKSTRTITGLVDVEVYDPAGKKVYQRAYDNVQLSGGVLREFRQTWQVPTNAVRGTYTVKIGIFKPGWGELWHWNNKAVTFTVR